MIQLQKAKRTMAKIKLAIGGPTGSGKTASSLLLAYGLVKAEHPDYTDEQVWEKVCVIDTENHSASLYSNFNVGPWHIGEFYSIPIEPPFEASKYIEAIQACENAEMDVIIVDSLTHAWTGVGGALDKQSKIAARTGNSYTAWRDVTPEHNRLVDAMLQSRCHVIADMRAKQEYVQEKNQNGKTVVRNVGMGLQMRDGVEYEFTTCFMLDQDHTASATKDRTGLFDGKYFTITPDTGKAIYQWLSSGEPEKAAPPAPKPAKAEHVQETPPAMDLSQLMDNVDKAVKAAVAADPDNKKQVVASIKEITGGTANYTSLTDAETLMRIYDRFKKYVEE